MVDNCSLPLTISALGCAIAARLRDEELALAAAVLTQLGDTLATIAVERNLCPETREKEKSPGPQGQGLGNAKEELRPEPR